MPVCVKKVKDKYRIVNCTSQQIETNKSGTPLDGGGHNSKDAAMRQMRAINANLEKD